MLDKADLASIGRRLRAMYEAEPPPPAGDRLLALIAEIDERAPEPKDDA